MNDILVIAIYGLVGIVVGILVIQVAVTIATARGKRAALMTARSSQRRAQYRKPRQPMRFNQTMACG